MSTKDRVQKILDLAEEEYKHGAMVAIRKDVAELQTAHFAKYQISINRFIAAARDMARDDQTAMGLVNDFITDQAQTPADLFPLELVIPQEQSSSQRDAASTRPSPPLSDDGAEHAVTLFSSQEARQRSVTAVAVAGHPSLPPAGDHGPSSRTPDASGHTAEHENAVASPLSPKPLETSAQARSTQQQKRPRPNQLPKDRQRPAKRARQDVRNVEPNYRCIKKADVSDDWVFQIPGFGQDQYFILRCTNGTTSKVHRFSENPMENDRAIQHFKNSPSAGCHDINEDFHGRLEDMLRLYGLRVEDASTDWVNQHNAALPGEVLPKSEARFEPRQPCADMGDRVIYDIVDDDDDDENDEESNNFRDISEMLNVPPSSFTAPRAIEADDLAVDEYVVCDQTLVSKPHVVRCGHRTFDGNPFLRARLVRHLRGALQACHGMKAQDYGKVSREILLEKFGFAVDQLTFEQAQLRNERLRSKQVKEKERMESRKKTNNKAGIHERREKVSGRGFRGAQ